MDIGIWAILGFAFAAYAVVGNDALQTLGTFIHSNRQRPWPILFAFAATVLVVVFTVGWITNDGDPSFGRLADTDRYPVIEAQWFHVLPPFALLILTRFGIPVSTTFMVLTIFATMAGMQSMLIKSAMGYVVAFGVGGGLYVLLAPTLERYFLRTYDKQQQPAWILLQWLTTGYLWAVWLMQDFANLFIFLPRKLDAFDAAIAILGVLVLLMITFANGGGPGSSRTAHGGGSMPSLIGPTASSNRCSMAPTRTLNRSTATCVTCSASSTRTTGPDCGASRRSTSASPIRRRACAFWWTSCARRWPSNRSPEL